MQYSDFKYIRYLGKGAYGTVSLVKCNINDKYYALKQLLKVSLAKYGRVHHLLREKDIMNKCNHPNIVRLENTFKDDESCYFVLEYHALGELTSLIKKAGKLKRSLTRFYAKEIINALQYFREKNIVHRDLKPENILIDHQFHWKVSDFGTAKIIDPEKVAKELENVSFEFNDTSEEIEQEPDFDEFPDFTSSDSYSRRSNTFIGTPLYVSPEMLTHNIAWFGSDLWGLGCIIYHCLWGAPPFIGQCENQVFDKILECKVDFPPDIDIVSQDLILRLLQLDPRDRLGAGLNGQPNNLSDLKNHEFFKKDNFDRMIRKKPPVPQKLITKINSEWECITENDDDKREKFKIPYAPKFR